MSPKEFKQYLLQELTENSAGSYLSYLRTCTSEELPSLQLSSGVNFLDKICNECNAQSDPMDKFNIVQGYISELSGLIDSSWKVDEELTKKRMNIRSALRSLSNYATSGIVRIDGIRPLTNYFPTIGDFVRFVIAECFIFSEHDMRNRFTDLTNNMKNGIAVPSRLSTKGDLYNGHSPKRGEKGVTYNDGTCSVLVDIDSNGNAAVDKLLKDLTGFYMKNRKNRKSNFINYNISHIWGRAFDPRYFTSLWNIALVPSFANSVLDKPESLNGSYTIGAYLLNTLKAVLYKL